MKPFSAVIFFALVLRAIFSQCAAADVRPFEISVVDSVTGRGVPLVEIETMDCRLHVTDSAGRIAFNEPGQMGVPVWNEVR